MIKEARRQQRAEGQPSYFRGVSVRRRWTQMRGDESGLAMVMVLGFGVVLMLIAAVVLDNGVSSLKQSGRDQDFLSAIAAADAGIDDYVYRVNADSQYTQYTSVAKTCTGSTAPTANLDPFNAAMAGYTPMPGAPSHSSFTYTVDTSSFCTQGVIKVTATGKTNARKRTEQALIKRRGFLDFLYFTDIETQDPALYTTNPFSGKASPNNTPVAVCGRHYYDPPLSSTGQTPRPDDISNNPGCASINFGGGDVINGPVHTNDAMLVCGAVTFKGKTTTSWTGSNPTGTPANNVHWRANPNNGCNNAPAFTGNSGDKCLGSGVTNDACYAIPLNLPPSNSSLKAETDPALTASPGCLFTGPTKITLKSNGTMDVTSPDTSRTAGTFNVGCGLNSSLTAASNIAIPADGVIYVQNVPAGSASQPCSKPNNSWISAPNPVGFPASAADITPYGCTDGDVFVSGTTAGGVTIGAEHNIDITNNLAYNSGTSGNDLLGLVANNYVEIYHPVDANGNNLSGSLSNPSVFAAILSVTHSFRVQNYLYGSNLGSLSITGAISQKYRGAVGLIGGSGYVKNYAYDQRLKYASPPKFIDPVQSAYAVSSYAEQ